MLGGLLGACHAIEHPVRLRHRRSPERRAVLGQGARGRRAHRRDDGHVAPLRTERRPGLPGVRRRPSARRASSGATCANEDDPQRRRAQGLGGAALRQRGPLRRRARRIALASACSSPAARAGGRARGSRRSGATIRSPGGSTTSRRGAEIGERALLDALARAAFVLLGESHENADHHLLQARLVAGARGARRSAGRRVRDAARRPAGGARRRAGRGAADRGGRARRDEVGRGRLAGLRALRADLRGGARARACRSSRPISTPRERNRPRVGRAAAARSSPRASGLEEPLPGRAAARPRARPRDGALRHAARERAPAARTRAARARRRARAGARRRAGRAAATTRRRGRRAAHR